MYVTDGSCNEVIAIVRRIFVKFGLTLSYDGFVSTVYLACRAGVTILFEATARVHNVEDRVLITKPVGVIEEAQKRIYLQAHRN